MIDEKEANVRFLESAYEDFQDAMDEGRIFAAKAVIEKLVSSGFDKEAKQFADELLELKSGI